jgi:hypothetical protein
MFNKKEFEVFRMDVEKALQDIAKKYDVNIHAGHITYTSDNFKLNLEVTKKEVNGKSYEQAEFEKYCILFGLEPKDYNRQFKSNGTVFTIYGLNLKAKTMPVLARTTDGRGFKFGAETVKRLLG